MSLRGRLPGLCLAFPAALGLVAGLPPAKTPWFEARTAHFRCVTDAPEATARAQAQNLELIHAILTVLSPDLKERRIQPGPQFPTTVFLFADTPGFKAYCERSGLEGYCVPHPDGFYIAVATDAPDAPEVPIHEYLHRFLGAQFPGVPVWLNEGLACFFQTLERRDQEVQLGRPPHEYLRLLATRGAMPVARLLADTATSPDYADTPDRPWFYASSWLLTDYFMTGPAQRRDQLGAYLDLIRAGRDPEACRQLAFGRTAAELDQDLRDHLVGILERHRIRAWIIRFQNLPMDTGCAFRPLPRAEALGRLGLLALGGGGNRKAMEHFGAALALDPRCVPANTGMGLCALQAQAPQEAAAAFARALEGEPQDAVLHFLAGASLYGALPREGESLPATRTAALAQSRSHLLRALELGCPEPAALPMLSAVMGQGYRPTAAELAALERACRLLPGQFQLKASLAEQYRRNGQTTLARSLLEEVAAQTVEPDLARQAGSLIHELDAQEADRLHQAAMDAFRRKAYEDARAAMKEALALPLEPRLREQFERDFKDMEILIDLRTRPAKKGGRTP